jgi:hypothetical protein
MLHPSTKDIRANRTYLDSNGCEYEVQRVYGNGFVFYKTRQGSIEVWNSGTLRDFVERVVVREKEQRRE